MKYSFHNKYTLFWSMHQISTNFGCLALKIINVYSMRQGKAKYIAPDQWQDFLKEGV